MKTLITGATGNVGLAVLRALQATPANLQVLAGVRNLHEDSPKLTGLAASPVHFDFEDTSTFAPALQGVDVLFLLRPPQLADVARYFQPLIAAAKDAAVKHILFLSVQGVENSKIIPHHKIEKLIRESGLAYTFLRPGYFMQNFTTTLRHDLVTRQLILLPAGNATFTLIDVTDIGLVTARILTEPQQHINKSYELTNREQLTFAEMAAKITRGTGKTIRYVSPNLLHFFIAKRREGVPAMLILVMIMLHYLPRFQQPPATNDWVRTITGREPRSFDEFVARELQLR